MTTAASYHIDCLPMEDITKLEHEWRKLEEQAGNTFFLSWAWIGTWLKTYEPNAEVMRAFIDGKLVALAIFVKGKEKRHLIVNSSTLQLHQTGDPSKDQVWIEYNGFLTSEEHHQQVTVACVEYLTKNYREWDELIIGAITQKESLLFSENSELNRHELWAAPCYGVDLSAIRGEGKEYLSTLSRNTRYQVRRSLKKYKELGGFELDCAKNREEALRFFDEIGPLHLARWGSDVGQSGFANSHFVNFHRELIASAFDKGNIDIWRVVVNGKPIAYFYNFRYRGKIYFYLSGLQNESNSALKPGLLGHSLCIQQYLDDGLYFYDFMGGGDRYKASLGKKHNDLLKLSLQKPKLSFSLEQSGRKLKKLAGKLANQCSDKKPRQRI